MGSIPVAGAIKGDATFRGIAFYRIHLKIHLLLHLVKPLYLW